MGIRQVALEAGVSTTTASRALSGTGRVGEATRARVLEAADRLGYQPDDVARQLRSGASATLAVLVPDITNPFFPELVKGVQDAADEHEHLLLLAQTGDDPEVALRLLAQMSRRRVEGVVIVGAQLPVERAGRLVAGTPVVFVDRSSDLPGVDVVLGDQRAGGALATEHLVALGHRRIAHIAGPLRLEVARRRRNGYFDALAAAGLPADPGLVVEAAFDEEGGQRGVEELLDRQQEPTAVFAGNDLIAIGAIRALNDAGHRVPEDVSVVGFDDIHLAAFMRPGLTTVRQPTHEMGRLAVQLLLEQHPPRTGRTEDRLLPTHLVRRGTTTRAATPDRGGT